VRLLEDLVRLLKEGGRLTVLTGAGISAESGIRTFRDAGGLWENHRLEEVATPEAFERDPHLVHRFYNARRRQLHEVEPNAAHRALAELEERLGERFTLITQNIDDLHERAGSRRALHMHGEILKARCLGCRELCGWPGDLTVEDRCARCRSGLRPHIVWFGEMPFYMEREIPQALGAEVFAAIGTSGVVYPAAGFAAEARSRGALTVELNLEPSAGARLFHGVLLGKATETVVELARALLAG
jgi:NAD-dependent deacetylase